MLNKFVKSLSAALSLIRPVAVVSTMMWLTACSFLQPAPEIIDEGPKEKPLPPQLIEAYNSGLELLQDMDEVLASGSEGDATNEKSGESDAVEKASQHWQALAEQFPEYPGVWTNLALTQLHLKQYEASHNSLTKALTINPEFCPGFKLKGLVERELGKFTDAETSYLAALKCDPKDPDIPYNLGILYDLYLHDLPKALVQYEMAQQLLKEPDETLAIWIPDLQRRNKANQPADVKTQVAGE